MRQLVVLFAMLVTNSAFAAKFSLDHAHSEVGFEVKHLVLFDVKGRFDKFSGEFEFDDKTGNLTNVMATIEADSINTNEPDRDKHLRSADFFETSKFKTITFKGKKVNKSGNKPVSISGDLTIHGVTKPVTLNLEYQGIAQDAWGNTKLGFKATGEIDRKEFGLTWNKKLDKGGLAVGEKVKIIIAGQAGQKK
ncbi:MAG: polyisoprenoid-binding protein [Bdellovibrionales bacterium]|nr:polyisoprenoid-binding protein [Bdellovibrionales bacterium]